MQRVTFFVLLLSTVSVFSQSPLLKTGENIDDDSFLKSGGKEIIKCDGSTVFFTTGGSIGKLEEDKIVAKYVAGKNNGAGFAYVTKAGEDNITRFYFGGSQLKAVRFSTIDLLPKKEEIIKDYKTGLKEKVYYSEEMAGASENNQYFAYVITFFNKKGRVIAMEAFLFDANLSLVHTFNIKHTFGTDGYLRSKHVAVSNEGDVAICFREEFYKQFKVAREEMRIIVVNPDNEHFITLPEQSKYLIDYTAEFDPAGNLFIAGYFGNSKETANATFSFLFDKNTQTLSDLEILDFPAGYNPSISSSGLFSRDYPFSTKTSKILFVDKSTAYLVGYEHFVYLGEGVATPLISQYSRSVVLTKLNDKAQPESLTFIEAATIGKSTGSTPEEKNFSTATSNGKLYIVYLDHVANLKGKNVEYLHLENSDHEKEVCILATITPGSDNPIEKEIVYNNSIHYTGRLLTNSLYFNPEAKSFQGFMTEKISFQPNPPNPGRKTTGLKHIEIVLP